MKKKIQGFLIMFVLSILISFSIYGQGVKLSLPEAKYSPGNWSAEPYGNYRAVIEVENNADAVFIRLPWRRQDFNPQEKKIIVTDASTGKEIENVFCAEINREYGDIVFQPETVPGEYHIYYMPYRLSNHDYNPVTNYLNPEDKANPKWKNSLSRKNLHKLKKARFIEFQVRDSFYNVDPMKVIATEEETSELLKVFSTKDYLLFPEYREFPVAMIYDLPLRWIKNGPSGQFIAQARPGEYFTFQIGYYALKNVDNIEVVFESGQNANVNFTCFNTGGIDWKGEKFQKQVQVKANQVQSLWCGLQVPADFTDELTGKVKIRPLGFAESSVEIKISVSGEILADGGVSNLSSLSRLKWLNSDIGLDDEAFGIYTPVSYEKGEAGILGRKIKFDRSGFPAQIISMFDDMSANLGGQERELLASPIKLIVAGEKGEVEFGYGAPEIIQHTGGVLTMLTEGDSPNLKIECWSKTECDGYISYSVKIKVKNDCTLNDIRLEIPMQKEIAEYMMGMGRKGGYRPGNWDWKWDINRSNSIFWLGTVGAGLQCRLKGFDDVWEMVNFIQSGIPENWYNNGNGGCTMQEEADAFNARIYSGARNVKAGDELLFRFGLLITPVRPLDNNHWNWRYWHSHEWEKKNSLSDIIPSGANIVNIHHGTAVNPYINYPFIMKDTLQTYIREAHSQNLKVKLYYTVRELSIHAPELYPIWSLGGEICRVGEGFRLADRFTTPTENSGAIGESWLREHLNTGYIPAWHHYIGNEKWDVAIAQTGLSRWHNYYLEGLNWLINEVGVDGIYIDGLGYDREIMKRVRKVMDRSRPGCLIDFHCGNHFHPQYGLNNISNFFMEHFPFMNSLWLGEGFDYNESPDYWLVEVAGIPYGLYGEMLGKGNPWRGMVFGMTDRLMWGGNPKAIWKLWDDFGIDKSQMLGYWSKRCPVKTGDDNIKATTYIREGKTLIAIGSWASDTTIKLDIDWGAIGIDKSKAVFFAPEIEGIQTETSFKPDEPIPVKAEKGYFLIVSE